MKTQLNSKKIEINKILEKSQDKILKEYIYSINLVNTKNYYKAAKRNKQLSMFSYIYN